MNSQTNPLYVFLTFCILMMALPFYLLELVSPSPRQNSTPTPARAANPPQQDCVYSFPQRCAEDSSGAKGLVKR